MNGVRLRPSFCGFLAHTLKRLFCTENHSFHTVIGLVLVALNVPIGWGGSAICLFVAVHYDLPICYKLAALIYLGSWLMLGLGIILAGQGAVRSFRARIPRAWRAWRRMRNA